MTPEERQNKFKELQSVRFVIHGFLKSNADKKDACICEDELSFKKELEKFEVYRVYKLVEIHKR